MDSQLEIEAQYKKLKSKTPESDWNNPGYLYKLAKQNEVKSTELAYRLLQRAHNLRPNGETINHQLELYRKQIAETNSAPNLKSKQNPINMVGTSLTLAKRIKKQSTDAKNWLSQKPFYAYVVMPWLIFVFYTVLLASPRFESSALIVVKTPDAMSTLSPEMALLSGFGVTSANEDSAIVSSFIYSSDMIDYLESTVSLSEHFSDSGADFVSRLNSEATREDLYEFYRSHVAVNVQPESGILEISAQGFTAEYSMLLAETIIKRAEWFINEISHQLADAQLNFVKGEHEIANANLKSAQQSLLLFQQKNGLLDPESEGAALQSITYGLESQIASKNAELKGLVSVMSESSSQVIQVRNELNGLRQQLQIERERLSKVEGANQSLSEVLAKFSELKIEVEMAVQAYSASLVSLEKSRVEAYRQIKYLVTIQKPGVPQENTYPKTFYNSLLLGLVLLLGYGIIRIVVATIKELK